MRKLTSLMTVGFAVMLLATAVQAGERQAMVRKRVARCRFLRRVSKRARFECRFAFYSIHSIGSHDSTRTSARVHSDVCGST